MFYCPLCKTVPALPVNYNKYVLTCNCHRTKIKFREVNDLKEKKFCSLSFTKKEKCSLICQFDSHYDNLKPKIVSFHFQIYAKISLLGCNYTQLQTIFSKKLSQVEFIQYWNDINFLTEMTDKIAILS
jgi:hypothetical protein